MANFAILAADGQTIVMTGNIPREDFEMQALAPGQQFKALADADAGITSATHKFDTATAAFVQVQTPTQAAQSAAAAARAKFAAMLLQMQSEP